jgi:hypothetical protein
MDCPRRLRDRTVPDRHCHHLCDHGRHRSCFHPLNLGFERPQPLPLRTEVSRLSRELGSLFGRRAAPAQRQSKNLAVGFYSTRASTALRSTLAPILAARLGRRDADVARP